MYVLRLSSVKDLYNKVDECMSIKDICMDRYSLVDVVNNFLYEYLDPYSIPFKYLDSSDCEDYELFEFISNDSDKDTIANIVSNICKDLDEFFIPNNFKLLLLDNIGTCVVDY